MQANALPIHIGTESFWVKTNALVDREHQWKVFKLLDLPDAEAWGEHTFYEFRKVNGLFQVESWRYENDDSIRWYSLEQLRIMLAPGTIKLACERQEYYQSRHIDDVYHRIQENRLFNSCGYSLNIAAPVGFIYRKNSQGIFDVVEYYGDINGEFSDWNNYTGPILNDKEFLERYYPEFYNSQLVNNPDKKEENGKHSGESPNMGRKTDENRRRSESGRSVISSRGEHNSNSSRFTPKPKRLEESTSETRRTEKRKGNRLA